jgi:hypothetical protein
MNFVDYILLAALLAAAGLIIWSMRRRKKKGGGGCGYGGACAGCPMADKCGEKKADK